LERGRPSFPPDFSCPVVLTDTPPRAVLVGYRALTVSGGPSQGPSPKNCFAHSGKRCASFLGDRTTPTPYRPRSHLRGWVWALPVSLAATSGISIDFCAGGTKMFLFPPLPSRSGISRVTWRGCPIRTSTDQRVVGPSPSLLAAVLRPSSAPQRHGIHRPLSLALALDTPSLLRLRPIFVCS
jgi:hypothetical protein